MSIRANCCGLVNWCVSRCKEPLIAIGWGRRFSILSRGVTRLITAGQNLRLKIMRTSLSLQTAATVAIMAVLLLSCGKKSTETNSQAAVSGSAPVDYSSRVGVAVRTGSRTCVAIKNGAVPGNSPVTLVVTASSQRFVEAQISGPSPSPCPITKEAAPEMSNYEMSLPKSSNFPNSAL